MKLSLSFLQPAKMIFFFLVQELNQTEVHPFSACKGGFVLMVQELSRYNCYSLIEKDDK